MVLVVGNDIDWKSSKLLHVHYTLNCEQIKSTVSKNNFIADESSLSHTHILGNEKIRLQYINPRDEVNLSAMLL